MKYIQALIIAILFTASNTTFASSLPDFPFIGVTGNAEIEVKPDTVEIKFGTIEFSDTPQKSLHVIKEKGESSCRPASRI